MMNSNTGYVYLMICCLNALITPVMAQSETIRFGFSVNKYAFNRFNYEVIDSTDINGTGFTIGFSYEKPILNRTSFLIGFGFSQRNNEVKYFKWGNADRTHWASFPISMNYYLFKNLAVEIGCQYEHLIFKQKFVEYSDSLQQKPGYTKYDIGLIAGIRFQIQNFELNGCFNYGLRNIYSIYGFDPARGIGINASAKSYYIKIGLNYLFQ